MLVLQETIIEKFSENLEKIIVVEEKRSIIETQVKEILFNKSTNELGGRFSAFQNATKYRASSDKEKAKSLGSKWDPKKKKWYYEGNDDNLIKLQEMFSL